MRTIDTHKLAGLNEALKVIVLDQPGHGGACHRYSIQPEEVVNEHTPNASQLLRAYCDIRFQNGPLLEHGVNGVSGEAIIAVLIDRYECFQAGPYASDDNAEALSHLQGAMTALQRRTRERIARGVEGKSIV